MDLWLVLARYVRSLIQKVKEKVSLAGMLCQMPKFSLEDAL